MGDFSPGAIIDVTDLTYSALATDIWNGATNTLTISNASGVASVSLAGSYAQDNFALASDGGSGTEVVFSPTQVMLSGLDESGNAVEGTTVTVTPSDTSLQNVTYTWLVNGTVVQIGASNSYTPAEADDGRSLDVVTSFTDPNNSSQTDTVTALAGTVADAPLNGSGGGQTISATEGAPNGNQIVATFMDANLAASASDFTATINWGDGSAATTGTVVAQGNGSFAVLASHSYAEEGPYAVVTTVDDAGGSTTTVTSSATITPVAEGPVFGGATSTSAAEQGGLVTLGATVSAADTDDTLGNVTITGLAHDLTNFSAGTYTASTGTWTGAAAQFDALTFKAGEDGVQNLTISAATTGAEASTSTESYTLTINPVAEGPVFGGATSTTVSVGGAVTLAATDTVSDSDDTLGNVTITGLPSDLTNFSSGTYTAGTWTGTATQFNALTFNAGAQGTFNLTIAATTTGAEAGTSTEGYTLTVSNIGPIISGTLGSANEGGQLTLGLTDAVRDSGDTLGNVTITGLPGDLTTFSFGTYTAGTGTWIGTAAQFNALTFNAGEDGHFGITVSATESGVGGGTTMANYTLTINPVAETPVLTLGGATATVAEGSTVALPSITASGVDGDDTVTVTIAGLAAGATITDSADSTVFSGSSFTLTGAEVGSTLTLHDGSNEGNFTLTVTANNTTAGETASSAAQTIAVTVNPAAETPVLTLGSTTATVAEGSTVALPSITASGVDGDDTVTLTIAGLAAGATITDSADSHGVQRLELHPERGGGWQHADAA